ncbi:conserved oligomeric Golgi complex subunit 7 [Anthonomus grandis grandis]|uniref:conserved oligomeric Golgi complex subunit 7 n=1 Tax=Anthonomus grandis grandis TaxID=2921223 RepID=UPI0021653FB5|nr:conserved oligomeric Golgi complex subunit 7 [Anthonomus grandis grandis]
MDISAFSKDDSDVKEWVNRTLKPGENQNKRDGNYTMGLVMKLQLYVQQVNNSLEGCSVQVLNSLPKILRDVKVLQQDANVLKDKMSRVKQEIVEIEVDTRNSITTIEKLDMMKRQLEVAKRGLHESDNWTVLVNDLEEMFDSKNIEGISQKILGMQSSLKLLANVADYEDRKLQLEGLKNRLEAIASPVIVQGFTSGDIEQSAKFVSIFSSIGRLPELMKYHRNCQRDLLVQKWFQITSQEEPVTQWVHHYYDYLISNWHTHTKWFHQVFEAGEPATEPLINVYVDVLTSLEAPFRETIDSVLIKQTTTDKLAYLIEIKEMADRFAENLRGQCGPHEGLLRAVYAHLRPYVGKYAEYEQAVLVEQLKGMRLIKEELTDTVEALGFSIDPVMDYASEGRERCRKLTGSCGFCGLLVAIRAYLSSYAGYFRVALRQLDRSSKSNVQEKEEELEEDNWTNFQLCFTLLQHCGEVVSRVRELEKQLIDDVLTLNRKSELKRFLLDGNSAKEFDSLVKCVTEGTELAPLDHVTRDFGQLCVDVHHVTRRIVFAPISAHLGAVPVPETWQHRDGSGAPDLPDYSFTPQEYVTQIGQYLMELPQHLEPFLFKVDGARGALACALRPVDREYALAPPSEGALAQVFLRLVARGACDAFAEKILAIPHLSPTAVRQLAQDIGYLNDVLQDLGITMEDNLRQIATLLKLPADQYVTQSAGCSAKYVAAIRQLRNIASN